MSNVIFAGRILLSLLLVANVFSSAFALNVQTTAPDEDKMAHIMRLLGAQTAEDVTEDDYHEYSDLISNPININLVQSSRLLSCGLLSAYQVASIEDYKSRFGDILSLAELALLDGFSKEEAERIAPFISLKSSVQIGKSSYSSKKTIFNNVHLKTAWKSKDNTDLFAYALKYSLISGCSEFGLSVSEPYSYKNFHPDGHSIYYSYRGPKGMKLLIGDYYLRYGQGLAMWTGFSMSGVGSTASLFKKPRGITPCRSWTGVRAARGVAAEFSIGRWTLSPSLGIQGVDEIMSARWGNLRTDVKPNEQIALMPVLNVAYMLRNFRLSATLAATGINSKDYAMKAAFDFSACLRGVDFWTEVAADVFSSKVAVVAGAMWNCCENLKAGVCLRYYPTGYNADFTGAIRASSRCSNEHGVALSGDFSAGRWMKLAKDNGYVNAARRFVGNLSLDLSYCPVVLSGTSFKTGGDLRKIKAVLNCTYRIDSVFTIGVKLSEQIRSQGVKSSLNCRMDVKYEGCRWRGAFRANAVYGNTLALLAYLEGGYSDKIFTSYIKAGCFKVDDWDDRIYAYERDAPGSFNVPVYYGRGYWLSAFIGCKLQKVAKLYLKGGFTSWPWQLKGKEKNNRAELSVHLILSL